MWFSPFRFFNILFISLVSVSRRKKFHNEPSVTHRTLLSQQMAMLWLEENFTNENSSADALPYATCHSGYPVILNCSWRNLLTANTTLGLPYFEVAELN